MQYLQPAATNFPPPSLPSRIDDWAFAPEWEAVLRATARSASAAEEWDTARAAFFVWVLLHQDSETGALPRPNQNPWAGRLDAATVDRTQAAAATWLAVHDRRLWGQLGQVLNDAPLGSLEQRAVVEVCRLARTRTTQECRAVKVYARSWPSRSKHRVLDVLSRMPTVSDMCTYMASYRPAGLVPSPPFGLAAELVLAAGQAAAGAPRS